MSNNSWTSKLEKEAPLPSAMIDDYPDMVTNEKGIYAFIEKSWPNFFVYVGSATGKDGLHHRIVKQHLNPNYLETRSAKQISGKDDYQLRAGNHVIIRGKVAIDKSSFRKNLARERNLKAGKETLEYILDNYHVQYLPLPDHSIEEIKEIEKVIISENKPPFNNHITKVVKC